MDLGVVAQGLKVAHPHHRGGDGLLVEDAAGAEGYLQAEPVPDQAGEHLQLHGTHELQPDLPGADPQLGLIIGRNPVLRRNYPIVVFRPANPHPIPQSIALGRIEKFPPTAELKKTYHGTLSLFHLQKNIRGAFVFPVSVKYSAHSSIVQMFFMIFT